MTNTQNTPIMGERTELLTTSDLTKKIKFNPKYTEEIYQFLESPKENRIVLIHSVRGAGDKEPEFITKYINEQEAKGNAVYIPKKFNFQQDETGGMVICNTMRYVIKNAGLVAIGYNPDSEGTKFDYGLTLYNGSKPVTVLNPNLDITDSVYNWMRNKKEKEISLRSTIHDTLFKIVSYPKTHQKLELKLDYIARENVNGKPVPGALEPMSAIQFGLMYASGVPFRISESDLDKVKNQLKLEKELGFFKSYSNVALQLHEIYNPKKN